MASPLVNHSRHVIAVTLSRLAADNPQVTVEQARLALRAAYPFGQRENYPYKIWLREVSRALEQKNFLPPAEVPTISLTLLQGHALISCGWCHDGGCTACESARQELAQLRQRDVLEFMLQAETPEGVLTDWLKEIGADRLAKLYREKTKEIES